MDLHDALSQISDIRRCVHRASIFRGYRAMTTAFSGCVAVIAAIVQRYLVPWPELDIDLYLWLWMTAGLVCIGAAALAVWDRGFRSGSAVQRDLAIHAVEQLIPSLVAGGLVTLVICRFHLEMSVLLPGLWAIMLGLGVFASRRLLPKATAIVGGYYLMAGLFIIARCRGFEVFSPWVMGLTFGVGQSLAAGILWWTLERQAEPKEVDHGTA
jgi:hypothetical protein